MAILEQPDRLSGFGLGNVIIPAGGFLPPIVLQTFRPQHQTQGTIPEQYPCFEPYRVGLIK